MFMLSSLFGRVELEAALEAVGALEWCRKRASGSPSEEMISEDPAQEFLPRLFVGPAEVFCCCCRATLF